MVRLSCRFIFWLYLLPFYCCDRKSRAACAQSFALWQQATIEIMHRNLSYYCLLAPRIYIFVLCAHPVCGESHNQPGLSQMQLQKSLEQYQKIPKIPKSVLVQHKIGMRMINVENRTKYHLQNKLK